MMVQRFGRIVFATVLSSVMAFSQDVDRSSAVKSLKVDVELVNVDVYVTDDEGRHVAGLERDYFRVWEDKIEQKIESFATDDAPLSVGIIFDVSGSMTGSLERAKEAALTFLKSGNRDDEFFLVEFSDRPKLNQDFTSDVNRIKGHLTTLSAKGATSLYDGVYLGLEKLRNAQNPRKALLVISDGEDNRSRYTFSDLKHFAEEQDVRIYSIGLGSGFNFSPPVGSGLIGGALLGALFGRSPLEDLADLTGGEAFFPQSLSRLDDICNRIAAGLKTHYSIGYHSTNLAKDGAWRKLSLKFSPPKGAGRLHVRFKKGYFAATSGAVASR